MKLLALLVVILFATQFIFTFARVNTGSKFIKMHQKPEFRFTSNSKAQLDLCPTCVSILGQTIDQLLNIILNVGVIGGCNDLCGKLPQDTKAEQLLVVGCNLVCDYVGVKTFIDLIEKADLDPIWLCQETKICPIHDCTAPVCAQFTRTIVQPQSAPVGSSFTINAFYDVYNQTGTGELIFEVIPVGVEPFGDGELAADGFAPGSYQLRLEVTIKNDEEHQIEFLPGVYRVGIELCEGQCGSSHAHTRSLAIDRTNFTVTE